MPLRARARLIRPGFTVIELIIVITLMGIILAYGTPRMMSMRDNGAVRSAKQQISAYLATARAAAIRRGRSATFKFTGDTIQVMVATEVIGIKKPLSSDYSVTITRTTDSIVYDARGFATGLTATQKFKVTRSGYSDSLCVSRGGLIGAPCSF